MHTISHKLENIGDGPLLYKPFCRLRFVENYSIAVSKYILFAFGMRSIWAFSFGY